MSIKLSDLVSIAEITAAIGIILSLLFVGYQINEGTQQTRATTAQSSLHLEMLFQSEILRYPEIWEKIVIGSPLSPGVETRQGLAMYNMYITRLENSFHQREAGYLEINIEQLVDGITAGPFYDIWREKSGTAARSPELMELLDQARSRHGAE